MQTKTLAQWEREEIERSASDAAKAVQRDLRMHDVARYMGPPNDTVYQREYCYALLGDVSEKRVLDLGCGEGLDVVALAMRGAAVIGCDISPRLALRHDLRLRPSVHEAQRRRAAGCLALIDEDAQESAAFRRRRWLTNHEHARSER